MLLALTVLVVVAAWAWPCSVFAEPPDPEVFAAKLHADMFSAVLQAFCYGVGLGLLVKMINRS